LAAVTSNRGQNCLHSEVCGFAEVFARLGSVVQITTLQDAFHTLVMPWR
jgi:hypothetical protein